METLLEDDIFVIVKTAVYDHGVMWIGTDFDDAKAEADRLASHPMEDGHHSYEVRLFNKPSPPQDVVYERDWRDGCGYCCYEGMRK